MKSFYLRSLAVGLGLCLAGVAGAQTAPYGSPSLLPMPQANYRYPTTQTSAAQQRPPQPYAGQSYAGQPYAGQQQAAPQGNYNNNNYYASKPMPTPAPEQVPGPANYGPNYGQGYGQGYGHGQGAPMNGGMPEQYQQQPPYQGGYPPYEGMGGCNNGGMMGGPGCVGDGAYTDAMGAGCGNVCDLPTCAPHGGWYAGAAGLVMSRGTGNGYWFSYYDSNEAAQLLDTRSTVQWGGGAEAWVGKWFCCGQFGVQGVYWGLYPTQGETNLYAGQQPGNLNAILNFNQLNYNGVAANMSTDAAMRHRLRTNYQIHNVEINLLGGALGGYGSTRFNWLAGFRYMYFRDWLEFASDPTDTTFTGAAPEIYYDVDVDNNLFGFQLGGNGQIYLTQRFSLDLGTKFGIFANHVNQSQRIGGAAGYATINNGPFNNYAYNIASSSDTVSFLGEMKVGMGYQVTNNLRILGGYRAVGLTGVALTTDQIPMDLRGLNDAYAIDTNGSLILHGAYAGAEFLW